RRRVSRACRHPVLLVAAGPVGSPGRIAGAARVPRPGPAGRAPPGYRLEAGAVCSLRRSRGHAGRRDCLVRRARQRGACSPHPALLGHPAGGGRPVEPRGCRAGSLGVPGRVGRSHGAVVLGRLLTRRLPVLVGDAPLPPLWSQQDGLGLFVRGVFGFLLIGLAANLLLPKESLFTGISTLVAGVPMVWWTLRYFSRRGLSVPLAFGLKLQPGGVARIVGATLVISTLSVLGEVLITVGSDALHIKAH